MSKRLQVVMDEAEYREVQEAAAAVRMTVSEWVRRILREARRPQANGTPSDEEGLRRRKHERVGAAVREAGPAYGDLLERVMQRYGLPDAEAAVRFALRRAADPPLSREDILAMEGTGWEDDMAALRPSAIPEILP
jgi:hypothetical protein